MDHNPRPTLTTSPGPASSTSAGTVNQINSPGLHIPAIRELANQGDDPLARFHGSLIAELAKRRAEALYLYDPLESQERFHASRARIRLVRGSNRGGKTLPSAVEVARAVTGRDPYTKYPLTDGRAFLVGRDGRHLGDVMYRKLFRAGPFKIIRDAKTNLWRPFYPNDPEDFARKHLAKPSPPLIPQRFVKEIAWENKRANVPSLVRLVNGWELNFFSSNAKPPRGSDVDIVWFDEEIIDPEWPSEMVARILDRDGRIIWSATPQSGTQHLYELHEQAERELFLPTEDRVHEEFVILLGENKFIDDRAKEAFVKTIRSEDDYRVRVLGEFQVDSWRVYPEFRDASHVIEPIPIPDSWTRYLIIDPGRQRAAALFLAVPPVGLDPHRYFYDELYIKDCDAQKFAKAVADKIVNTQVIQAAWIDMHEGRKHESGSGLTIETQYSRALRKAGVKFVETGHGFYPAPDDEKGRIESLRNWLTPDESDITKLKVFSTLENLRKEFRFYHYKLDPSTKVPTDVPVKRNDHLADCAGYAAAIDPPYRKPKKRAATKNALHKLLSERRALRLKSRNHTSPHINLGPGA